ncbi:MAG: hypothetical protein PHQ98_01675 [Candidatus ainarchaeum sp.]|nr:hypothetical protein [Candidatus ainarchaeum sp.]
MNKLNMILVGLVITLILTSGCLQFMSPAQPKYNGEMKDCDYNKECFLDSYYNNCLPSKGNLLFSEQENSRIYGELRGITDKNECTIYLQLIDTNNPFAKMAIGSDMSCYLTESQMIDLMANFDVLKLNCNGSLYEGLKIAATQMK